MTHAATGGGGNYRVVDAGGFWSVEHASGAGPACPFDNRPDAIRAQALAEHAYAAGQKSRVAPEPGGGEAMLRECRDRIEAAHILAILEDDESDIERTRDLLARIDAYLATATGGEQK